MKKYYVIIMTAGLVSLAACNKEVIPAEEPEEPVATYIRASEESSEDTKSSISGTDASFTWNTGDRIAVYASGYKISNPLADTYDNTNAATFAFSGANAVTEADRANFAIFPASLVWDGTNIRTNSAANYTSTGLTVTLPASYTLTEVQNDKTPGPMIATNAPNGDLSFKHLCALLRVEVSNVPATTRRLVFMFNDKKVQGEFTLTDAAPGTSSIVTAVAEGTNNTITVFTPDIDAVSTLTINLPLPTGEYNYITISAFDRAEGGLPIYTNTRLIKKSSPGTWTSTRLTSRKISTALSQIAFSVSSTKKVLFAPGNLQYNSTETNKWRFAEHQYTMVGAANWSTSGWMDAFGWGTWTGDSPDPTKTSTNSSDYTWDSKDFIGDPTNNGYTWYTLSQSEWSYLIGRSYIVTITDLGTGVYGAILLPDDWPSPTSLPTLTSIRTYDDGNKITLDQWTGFENYGAVFLPAAGNYSKNSPYGNNNPNKLRYLSGSSKDGTNAYIFKSNNSKYTPAIEVNYDVKASKYSVRLAREL